MLTMAHWLRKIPTHRESFLKGVPARKDVQSFMREERNVFLRAATLYQNKKGLHFNMKNSLFQKNPYT